MCLDSSAWPTYDSFPLSHTLIFAVAALDLLMNSLLDFLLQYSCSCRFIVAGNLEDVGCVDPVVRSSSHDMVGRQFQLIDGDLE